MNSKLELMKEMRNDSVLLAAADALTTAMTEHAEIAQKVEPVQRQALKDVKVFVDTMFSDCAGTIYDPCDLYLAEDGPALDEYYKVVDARLRAAGLKPADMGLDYCPILVARAQVTDRENALIDLTLAHLGKATDTTKLTHRSVYGDKREKFLAMALGFLTAEWEQE